MLFGDALVHLPSRGLELLPDKYCTNPVALRLALQSLVQRVPFENAVFAHGSPLLGNARAAIAALLPASGDSTTKVTDHTKERAREQ